MEILIQIVLGLAQGVFEWLPISSEGIVALISSFLDGGFNPIDIALFLHLGTLLAAIIYFRKDWKEVVLMRNKQLLRFLMIATIISLAIGFPLYKFVENMAIGAGLLLLTGLGLLATAYFHKTKKENLIKAKYLPQVVGILQGFSVIPGFSRSGSTIFGLSLAGYTPKEILKTSYMLSVPVGITANAYLFLKSPNLITGAWISLIISFIVGITTLHFLIKIFQKINFFKFALIFAILCFLGFILSIVFL